MKNNPFKDDSRFKLYQVIDDKNRDSIYELILPTIVILLIVSIIIAMSV